MHRMMFALAVCVFAGDLATAQDTKPAVPAQPLQRKEVQPLPGRAGTVTAAKMAQLEEEGEVLDAERDVKKAHVRAAEVAMQVVEIDFQRVQQHFEKGVGTKEEPNRAKLAFDAAKAQLEIRTAELKVIEVKVKFARKRLEDAKAAGVRPVPNPRPAEKAVDPTSVRAAADENVAELKERLAKAQAAAEKAAAEVKKAEAQVKVAADELAKIRDIAMRGRVVAGTIEKAEAKVQDAKDALAKVTKERSALEDEVAALQKKLKGIEE